MAIPSLSSFYWHEHTLQVTDAVHKNGSFIFVQLWALGRAAEAEVLKRDGYDLVSSSDIPMTGGSKPRPLTTAEIQTYVKEYATAAQNAILAGFDGVEIHGANGMPFPRSTPEHFDIDK